MEIQVKELIEKIKKEGVEAADSQAAEITSEAEEKAKKIIADAEKQAEEIIKKARLENDRIVAVSEDAIRQAGRNLLISFRESVEKELNVIIGEKVSEVYSSNELSGIIVKVVENWSQNSGAEDISVLLNTSDLEKLEAALLASLKEKMIKGVTIKPNEDFFGGFRIAVDGGRAYFDYSAAEVIEMLSAYLSPKVTALLKEAEGI